MTSTELPLASEFPRATADDWRAQVDAVLKGADFTKTLVTTTYDGMAIDPLYDSSRMADVDPSGFPGLSPFTRGARAAGSRASGWDLRQVHEIDRDPSATNEAILTDLQGGATSVLLALSRPDAVAAIPRALEGVMLDVAPVGLEAGPWYGQAAEKLSAEWDRQGVPPSARLGSLRADPIGALARHGALTEPIETALAGLGAIVESVGDAPGVTAVAVDATVYADAGAAAAEEIALSLATGVAYLRALGSAGIGVEQALAHIEFTYSASADQFETISKFRAARRCWSRVAEACGAGSAGGAQRQHAVTAAAMMSRRDPWVNLLRTSVACFGATTGGAEIITVRPFDHALGVSDGLSRRLARNISHLLAEEAHVGDVIDPAGGSNYVEVRTQTLAELAWARFQDIERGGGVVAGLQAGTVQQRIQATATERNRALATRRDPLTGVSEFPDIHESPIHRPPRPEPAPVADPAVRVEALPLRRNSEMFERLRDQAEALSPRPTVFLANLGPVAAHTARANFAKNFFEAGGIEALSNDGFGSTDELVSAFQANGSRLAVLCSSDALYPDLVPAAASALKAAGCARLYLAGRPGDRAEADSAAGIDAHIFMGSDVIGTLEEAMAVFR